MVIAEVARLCPLSYDIVRRDTIKIRLVTFPICSKYNVMSQVI